MNDYRKHGTIITIHVLAILVFVGSLITPAVAQGQRTLERQITRLTAEVAMLKATIERLRAENAELRERLAQYDAPSTDAPEPAAQPAEPAVQEPASPDDTPTTPDDPNAVDSSEFDLSREPEADRRVYQRLQNRHSFEFEGMALEEVVQHISGVAGVNIATRWATLNAVGVRRDSEVNIRLSDATVEQALRLVLEQVAGVSPLGFYVSQGVITITTHSDLYGEMMTRVYDIRDLVTARLTDGTSRQEIIDTIIHDIMTFVDQPSWDRTSAIISGHQGQLTIEQTRHNHLVIGVLLAQWREARDLR